MILFNKNETLPTQYNLFFLLTCMIDIFLYHIDLPHSQEYFFFGCTLIYLSPLLMNI